MRERRQRSGRRIVVGIGNTDRGDDAVGRLATRLLAGRLPADVELLEHDGEATKLLSVLDGAATAYLIDAAVTGAAAGTVQRYDCARSPLPREAFGVSTHGFGPAEAIELARALGQLPGHCVVFAIEANAVNAGESLSPALEAAAKDVAGRIAAELTPPAAGTGE